MVFKDGSLQELKKHLKGPDRVAGIGFDATCSLAVVDRRTLKGKSVSKSGWPSSCKL